MARISLSLKCNELLDTTQSFIIQKMMKGVGKLNGRSDLRLPITVEMMVKLPNALDHASPYINSEFPIVHVCIFTLVFSSIKSRRNYILKFSRCEKNNHSNV